MQPISPGLPRSGLHSGERDCAARPVDARAGGTMFDTRARRRPRDGHGSAWPSSARRERKPVVVWAATVATAGATPAEERLAHASPSRSATELLAEHRPEALAIERLAWGRNAGSAMHVARATGRGDARGGRGRRPGRRVRAARGEDGRHRRRQRADKEQVRRALARVHGLGDVPPQPDAADAVAVALCHLQQAPRSPAASAQAAGTMISFLEGELVEKAPDHVRPVDVNGVGYDVLVAAVDARRAAAGRAARPAVHTRCTSARTRWCCTASRRPDERTLFDLLTGVTGVGPKVALAFLSVAHAGRAPRGRSRPATSTRSRWSPASAGRSPRASCWTCGPARAAEGEPDRRPARWPRCARRCWRSGSRRQEARERARRRWRTTTARSRSCSARRCSRWGR